MFVSSISCITPPAAAGVRANRCKAGGGEGYNPFGCGVCDTLESAGGGGGVSHACPVGSVTCGRGYGNDSGGDAVGGGNGSINGDAVGSGNGSIGAGSESFSLNGFSMVDGIIASSVLMERKVTLLLSDSEPFFIVLVLIFVSATFSVVFDDDDDEDEVTNRVLREPLAEEELFVQEETDE